METHFDLNFTEASPFPEEEASSLSGEALFSKILKTYWGYDRFRGIQREIIQSIAAGKDTLGLMPTGGGKSIAFQVPAMAMEGVCLVVTPLVALMKDQVQNLRKRNIPAEAIHAGLFPNQIQQILDNCIFGHVKFLYVSPERLSSELFVRKLKKMTICFIAIDEAHCISQWGYDFRPSYLQIAGLRDLLPDKPLLALTATATPEVVKDICARLHFKENAVVSKMSFYRKNLIYVVRKTMDKDSELRHILRSVKGSAIVYARSRDKCRDLSKSLNEEGIETLYYHAGLTELDKDVRQQAWQSGEVRVMVATNAFGMGIDKPDVRLVIHMDMPDSAEAYFQEAGRAGRDGERAYAVLLYNQGDKARLERNLNEAFPPRDFIREVYESLAYFHELALGDGYNVTREFDIVKFCIAYKFFPTRALSAIDLLEKAGYVKYRDADENKSRIFFLIRKEELYCLSQLGKAADEVIQALMRKYGGLFSDYVTIQEKEIAEATGLSVREVCQTLKDLTCCRIAHYVPRKKIPYITYLRSRVEKERIVIGKDIYEERRAVCEKNIRAMILYGEQDRECRSSYFLHYFGETETIDCGGCDVCLSRKKNESAVPKTLFNQIEQTLADGKWHAPDEFLFDGIDRKKTALALSELCADEKILFQNGFYKKKS